MKIKDIIRTLVTAGEDFSDHTSGPRDGHGPLHDKGCTFCAAWREALQLLDLDPRLIDFEAGDKVTLPGGIPGRVMGTDVTVRVEVQNGEHGPWAVGSFSPMALVSREQAPEFTYWRAASGEIWEREESTSKMRLYRWPPDFFDGGPDLLEWGKVDRPFTHIEQVRGGRDGLVQVEKP